MRNRAFSGDSFDAPKSLTSSDPAQASLIPTELQETPPQIQDSIPEKETRFEAFETPFYNLEASILKAEAFNFFKESLSLILSQAANLFIIL